MTLVKQSFVIQRHKFLKCHLVSTVVCLTAITFNQCPCYKFTFMMLYNAKACTVIDIHASQQTRLLIIRRNLRTPVPTSLRVRTYGLPMSKYKVMHTCAVLQTYIIAH